MGADRGAAGGELTATAATERRRELPRRAAVLVLFALVVQFLALGLVQARDDALTVDEGVYLASGVTALTRHDLRLNPEQPALAKTLAALPVLLAGPVVPDTAAWDENRWFDYTAEFVGAQEEAGKLTTSSSWRASCPCSSRPSPACWPTPSPPACSGACPVSSPPAPG